MNPSTDKMSLQELETLSRAYLECRLSRVQEKELELVLLSSDHTSPVIDEARDAMGIAALIGESMTDADGAVSMPMVRKPGRPAWLRWSVAAACVAIVATVTLNIAMSSSPESREVFVYVNGETVRGENALRQAEETQEVCMAMLDRTVRNAAATQTESLRRLDEKMNN